MGRNGRLAMDVSDRLGETESFVREWMQDSHIPGASIAVVTEDDVLYLNGFGARNLDTNAPATPETLYAIGSVTKSFTALAVMKLVEASTLSIDDPVDRYVDHYATAPGPPIEVGELLSHTSGVPATPSGLFFQHYEGRPATVADEDDRRHFVRESTSYRVTDQDRFMYYNTGYNILGLVIEAVDGRTYADFVEEEILEPLGMARSTFSRHDFESSDDTITAYRPQDDGVEPTDFKFEELTYPAGGLISSVSELATYLRAMMTDGSVDGRRVCSANTVERLYDPVGIRQTYLDGTEQHYCLGWMREAFLDDSLVGHAGSNLVSTAYIGFLEEAGIGVALTSNTYPSTHPGVVGPALLAVVTGEDPTAVPAFALREKGRVVAGQYEPFRRDFTLFVEPKGAGLSIQLSPPRWWMTNEFTAYPVTLDPHDYRFYTVEGDGSKHYLEFDIGGGHDDLFFKRHRLRRTGTVG